MSDLSHPETSWNPGLARVIKREGEQAEALYVMYYKAAGRAKNFNDMLQIPQIVISIIAGFFSATSDMVPPIGIGALSIAVGILGAVNNYFKFSQRAENYRMVSNMYLKLYKHIEIELALPEKERIDPDTLLPDMREKMNRISEVAEPIPDAVISQFKREHPSAETSMPIIANGLNSIEINTDIEIPVSPIRQYSIVTPKSGTPKIGISV